MTEAAVYVMEKMAHGFKRMGRAAGRGFYDYEFDTPELWSGLKTFERRSTKLPAQDMSDRLAFAAVLAGLSLPDPATHLPAIAPLIGHALPSDHKQALTWARALGESRFSTRCAELSAQYGERFTMPRARDAQAVVQIHRKHSH
jgi:3-hydroxyacyl-CoA dehydrogenase/enoyl-CoA hydratase/3-hydroxybutyryl-CoA epimerase